MKLHHAGSVNNSCLAGIPGRSGQLPHLVAAAVAGPDLQPGAVIGAEPGRVQALVRVRVLQRAVAAGLPDLGTGTVAVPQLQLRAVGRRAAGHVQALAQGAHRTGAVERPPLGVAAVAAVELDRGAVVRCAPADVDALARRPGDLAGAQAGCRGAPLLVRPARAVPGLQPGAVIGAETGRVHTLSGLGIAQRAVAAGLPDLRAGAVAVPQLQLRAVGRRSAGYVQALAQGADRTGAVHRPPLRVAAVAAVELDRGAVLGTAPADIDALA